MERLRQWKGWKAVCKILCFLLLLAMALGRVSAVLALKSTDGLYTMQKFYEQPENSVDVLVLGSSLAYVNIDPGELWDEYGISSYDLCGGNQPTWNTFYYLKEALKTQRPRLIIMDAARTAYAGEYIGDGEVVNNTFGMEWSRDKVEAMRLSAPPDKLSSFLLSYTQYHARTRDLSRMDFLENMGDEAQYGCWKGCVLSPYVNLQEWPTDLRTEERTPIGEKTEEWYRKTIELAQSAGIPLLIVVAPFPNGDVSYQAIYNTAADIAAEYGVPFINFHQDIKTIGLDVSKDFRDSHHMNIWGAKKYTRYLGTYLTDHYSLPDHRGDPVYQSWEDNARYNRAYVRNAELARAATPEEVAILLQSPDYTCAVSVSGTGGTVFAPLLEALGIPTRETGVWMVSGGEVIWASQKEETAYFPLDYHDLKLTASLSGNGMVFDRGALSTAPDGVSILAYDAVTQTQAAYLTFDAAASN